MKSAFLFAILATTLLGEPSRKQSQIKGLFVFQLPNGVLASQMNATAIALKSNRFEGGFMTSGGNDDVLGKLIIDLNRLRPRLDPRTHGFADADPNFTEFAKNVRNRRTWNQQFEREIRAFISKIKSEREKLLNNPNVREELLLD